MFSKMIKNDEAVSPIVATLVLIVVAIIGAAAVGLLLGTFSNDVSEQANAGNTASQASQTLVLAGSTSMQPLMTQVGKLYTDSHDGIKVTVSGGGSGFGASAAGSGTADLGMMSEALTTEQSTAFPNLRGNLVAYSAVVVLALQNGETDALPASFSLANLHTIYTSGALGAVSFEAYYRTDKSGTQDSFFNAIGMTASEISALSTAGWATGVSGSSGMVNAIKTPTVPSGTAIMSFCDADYAFDAANGVAGTVQTITGTPAPTFATIKTAITKQDSTQYPLALTRGFYLVTNGPASGIQKDFIDYCRNPAQATLFESKYVVHYSTLPISIIAAASV